MKPIIITLAFLFVAVTSLRAQNNNEFGIEIQAGGGSGIAYIVEAWIKETPTLNTAPVAIFGGTKLLLPNSNWSFHLRALYMNILLKDKNWQNGYGTFNGDVTTISVFALAEHLHRFEESAVSIGFAFGLGFSDETIVPDRTYFSNVKKTMFLSAAIIPVVAFQITDMLSLRLEPALYWYDPVNSIRVLTNDVQPIVAGEDVNFLCLVGVSYKIK